MRSSVNYSTMKQQMKKIKNSSDLKARKMSLRVKELELEKAMRNGWSELKEKAQLKKTFKKASSDDAKDDTTERHWLVDGLSIGASLLTRKLMEKAGEKIEGKVEGAINSLLNKVQQAFDKKTKKPKIE